MKRIYHTWDKWECYPAGFYENKPVGNGWDDEKCREMYAEFLRDIPMFEAAMQSILERWPRSCEHYLSNESMNRIAWLGQAAMCYAHGVPSVFRGGFNRLTEEEQQRANESALKYLNQWLEANNRNQLMLPDALGRTEAELY